MATLPKLDVSRFETLTIREWLDRELSGFRARELVEALLRLSTYANAPDITGARSALAQLQLGVHGAVLYLDGGWRTIVRGLGAAARNAGAHIETSCAVAALEEDSVVLGDGRKLKASAIVLAVAPFEVARFTGHVIKLEPIRAACLDVALSRLPDPTTNFALGIDEPLYLSVHSSVAKLAPPGAALIHVARYLTPGEIPDVDAANRLEALLDLMQPGSREVVVEKRFLPKMTVTHAVVPLGGRPTDVDMLAMENVYVTGDWVGPVGMLSDTSLASARRVAERLGAVETKAGCMTDYQEVYGEHGDFLWGYCYRLTGSAADAEDLVQETFVRAIDRPPVDVDRPWRPWLVRVATNLRHDAWRKQKVREYKVLGFPPLSKRRERRRRKCSRGSMPKRVTKRSRASPLLFFLRSRR